MGGDIVRVGRVTVGLTAATDWIEQYTDPERVRSSAPYAFPAYDRFDAGSLRSQLTDGDLLAPALLNATPSLSAFYSLQAMRHTLEERLAEVGDDRLEDLPPDRIRSIMGLIYEPLDQHRAGKRDGLNGTTYSKVLHRKRPSLLPLHDRWVRACYVATDGPVSPAKVRSWAEYMSLLSIAMAEDIRTQDDSFAVLAAAAHEPLTRLRLLDIVAWKSQGRSHS